MESSEIKKVLIKNLELQEVYVTGKQNSFQIIAISEKFSNINQLEQQRLIYKPLMEYILDKRIHAISIKTFTPKEWISHHKLNFKF